MSCRTGKDLEMSKEIEAFNKRYGAAMKKPVEKLTTGTDKKPLTKKDLKKLQKPVKDFVVLEAFITNPNGETK